MRGAGDADFSGMPAAIEAASPRVVEVESVDGNRNGLGKAISILVRLDTTEPMSADDLDAMVEAAWRSSPFRPNNIAFVAWVGADDEAVDLETPGKELEPMTALGYGDRGANFMGMSKRYGEWAEPE